jgi:hypothetical protein
MLVIAVFALVSAWLSVWAAGGLLILVSLIAVPIVLTAPGGRLEAAAWVLCICPVGYVCMLYTTWLAAWFVMGHQPPWVFDQPRVVFEAAPLPFIVTMVLMVICPFALIFSGPVMLSAVSQLVRRKQIGARGAALRLSVPVGLWFCLYAIATWDLRTFAEVFRSFLP